jgi:anthranilate phosphoribosyltransferase
VLLHIRSMKNLLTYLFAGNTLTPHEAKTALSDIASGNQNDIQVAAFLSIYNMRMPTADEMYGFRDAMLELAHPLEFPYKNILDIVGTGGDGKDTFNISTLAALVCAGAGVKVAKHGNYGVSAVSGSSNVLEYLGVNFTSDAEKLNGQLEKANITFLHAPLFHPAMKHVAAVRKQLQVKTIFNLLGPLVNPCRPHTQLIGVYNEAVGKLYKNVLLHSPVNFAIVHSVDGYDEISLTAEVKILMKKKDMIYTPHAFGFDAVDPAALHGGNSIESNAAIFIKILEGNGTKEQNQVVVANAALAISLYKNIELEIALLEAMDSLKSGAGLECFSILRSIT